MSVQGQGMDQRQAYVIPLRVNVRLISVDRDILKHITIKTLNLTLFI
jgi:hypothetical protein